VVPDTSRDALFLENPDLPLTRAEAAIPLTARGKVIGVLDIQSIKQASFSPDEIDLLQSLADQLALAIQNTMLIEESRSALTQLEAALSENVRQAWSERGSQKRAYRYSPTGLAVSPIESGKPPAAAKGATQINIPIRLRGQLLGTIVLHRKGENTWGDADRLLVAEVADQIGLALENSRLLQDAQRRAVHEQMLSNLTTRLGQSVDADALLQTTVRELRQLPDVTEVSVFLAPPESAVAGEESQP
jgi:GAF domain-containing protein